MPFSPLPNYTLIILETLTSSQDGKIFLCFPLKLFWHDQKSLWLFLADRESALSQ